METLNKHTDWFAKFKKSKEYQVLKERPVAYFSAEYALDSALPTYAGGLGVLAGDYVREAALQGFPLLSVGILYKKAQSILFALEKNSNKKIKVLVDDKGEMVIVNLPIEDRSVRVKVWVWEDGNAKVFLLDTDLPENDERDREITKELYTEDRDKRLKQEIVLGIGGFRMLASLGYRASVYHLNEGHSAFLALELVRHEMEYQKVGFKSAVQFARKHVLFTNHTLVPAGQEKFSSKRVAELIEPCAMEICLNSSEIVKLGALEDDGRVFSMTMMSFRLSTKSNSVSRLHLEKAREIWPGYEMENVTNGVFVDRWDKIGEGDNIFEKHLENKKKLLSLVKETTGEVWDEKDLIFVWARRLVTYKQPLLFLDDLKKIPVIVKNSPVSIRIIFSGPTGDMENPFVDAIKKISEGELKGNVVFIPNYSLEIAEILTSGADIWLNTPTPGFEACGTSGMKAGLNGVLALSTNDGWISEVDPEEIGWVAKDSHNGEELRSFVEKEIIPLYVECLKKPKGSEWVRKMEMARNLVMENFSTTRALREYIEKLYIPVMEQKHAHKVN